MILKYKKTIFLLLFISLIIISITFPRKEYVLLKLYSEDIDIMADFTCVDKESLISQKRDLEIISGKIKSNNPDKKDNAIAKTIFYSKQECIKTAKMDIQDTKSTFENWKVKDVSYYNTGYYSKTGAERLVCLKYKQIQEFTEQELWGEKIYKNLKKFFNKYGDKISRTINKKDFPTYSLFPLE